MGVFVSQRNRAVSLKSVEAVATHRLFSYREFFALPGGLNILDGTGAPFTDDADAGWWGNQLSDATGLLPEPAVFTWTGRTSAYVFELEGIEDNFPVDFTISLYRSGTIVAQEVVADNDQRSLSIAFDSAYDIDKYELEITRISVANDVVKVATASFSRSISNFMKEPSRRIHGRVEVLYNNYIRDNTVLGSDGAHGASAYAITDESYTESAKYFKLYENDLTGAYKVIGEQSRVGWWPRTMPDNEGAYEEPQTLTLTFSQRNLFQFKLYSGWFEEESYDYPVDFDIVAHSVSEGTETIEVRNNTLPIYETSVLLRDITQLDLVIYKVSNPNRPCVIMFIPMESVMMYEDDSIIDMSLLEELTYSDEQGILGGISANELTVRFSNEDKSFYFNNSDSPIAGYIKKNRRMRAWLGIEPLLDGEIMWYPLGTFWTYSWDIPVGSLIAKTVAFDTIGLLNTITYYKHYVTFKQSIYDIVDTILQSASEKFNFLQWTIDEALQDIVIPVVWFEYDTYAAALNRVAACDLIDIYCNRDGVIVVKPKRTQIAPADDVWSDETNVISKSYPTLYTAPANDIRVYLTKITTELDQIIDQELNESVSVGDRRVFKYDKVVLEYTEPVATTGTAVFSKEAYSWGVVLTCVASGTFTGISASGTILVVDSASFIEKTNPEAILDNGAVERNIESVFIQTPQHAAKLLNFVYANSESSLYDVSVVYRGDIQLTLTDNVHLVDGIAPSNLYNIKRHQLFWNGALSGSADLSTYAYKPTIMSTEEDEEMSTENGLLLALEGGIYGY